MMRMSDILLFGPPFLLLAFGWGALKLSQRSTRNYRARHGIQEPAE